MEPKDFIELAKAGWSIDDIIKAKAFMDESNKEQNTDQHIDENQPTGTENQPAENNNPEQSGNTTPDDTNSEVVKQLQEQVSKLSEQLKEAQKNNINRDFDNEAGDPIAAMTDLFR